MPDKTISLSNTDLGNTELLLTINNLSNSSFKVQPPLHCIHGYNMENHLAWDIGETFFSFKVEYYDTKNKGWKNLDNKDIYNDVQFVGFPKGEEPKRLAVKTKDSYVEKIDLFTYLHLKEEGNYRIQIFLHVKTRKDASLTLQSNILELTLVK